MKHGPLLLCSAVKNLLVFSFSQSLQYVIAEGADFKILLPHL